MIVVAQARIDAVTRFDHARGQPQHVAEAVEVFQTVGCTIPPLVT
jgi:hypothetical protein